MDAIETLRQADSEYADAARARIHSGLDYGDPRRKQLCADEDRAYEALRVAALQARRAGVSYGEIVAITTWHLPDVSTMAGIEDEVETARMEGRSPDFARYCR